MTELEQKFFEAFNIPKSGCSGTCTFHSKKWYECEKEMGVACPELKYSYPPITADIVLGLIGLMGRNTVLEITTNNYFDDDDCDELKHSYIIRRTGFKDSFNEFNTLKEAVLNMAIKCPEIKDEVRGVFND